MSVRIVSPEADRWTAMASMLSMLRLSLASSRISPRDRRAGLQLLRANAADAHLYPLAVAEAALEQDDAAIGQGRGIGDVEAADVLERDRVRA